MRPYALNTGAVLMTAFVFFVPPTAGAAPFTHHLDAAIAMLGSRLQSGELDRRERRAVEKSLKLAAKPHDRLSQDIKTGAKICSLVARKVPSDRELFDIVDAGLDAMIAEVSVNVSLVGAVLIGSELNPVKQRKHLAKIRALERQARSISDPARRARRYAKLQRTIEKLFDRYGTVP